MMWSTRSTSLGAGQLRSPHVSADEDIKRVTRAAPVYVERDAQGKCVGLTPDGLALVTNLASYTKPQVYIASKLGLTRAQFEKLLGSSETASPVRLAWEAGHAVAEDQYRKVLMR